MNAAEAGNLTGLAAHLEEIACRFTDIGTSQKGAKFIGLDLTVEEAISYLLTAMFPYHFGKARERFVETEKRTWELMRAYDALNRSLIWVCESEREASEKAMELIDALPEILEVLKTDIRAGYEGDPAAKSVDEVILTYPAFKAISIYRMAHKLYEMQVPLVPRMMTEYAHRITGIDIHPGATIGKYFFIDHGTGVVIGETCIIGDHVTLYQGVTLGAKNFQVDDNGRPVNVPRHPIIGNHVTIYANSTILGRITIGENTVIGGNIWLTHSVPPGSRILQSKAVDVSFSGGLGI